MNTLSKHLLCVVGGLFAVWVTVAANPSTQPEPTPKPAPAVQEKPAGEAQAPLLLDASLRVAAQQPVYTAQPAEPKDFGLPPSGRMHVTMDILVAGRPLPTVQHAGKTYLPVPHQGEEYQIRVWNHGARRVAAVVSVDGLSVITGQAASEHGPGYIVAPYSHVLIKGWRRSLDNVAAFRFVARDQSYANLMGKPENIGVIGLVAIEEKVLYPLPRLERTDAAAAKQYRPEVGSIGTEYGRELDSRAYYVPFLRSNHKQTVTLYYDTVAALRAAGVPVEQPYPRPFPGDLEFAPPPPGYRK